MNREKTTTMVINGFMIAIILVLTLVPNLGFIQIPPLSLTIIHIPVILGGILFGFKSSILLALAFGISSWFVASTRGFASDVLFMNPLISVLPRLLFGLSIPILWALAHKMLSSRWALAFTGMIGSLVHSLLVLGAIMIALGLQNGLSFAGSWFITTLLSINIIIEAAVSGLMVLLLGNKLSKMIG